MNSLQLISQLLPVAVSLAPGGAQAQIFLKLAGNLVAYIQQQSGLTTEQILDRAGATLDQNEIDLLNDLASLKGTGGGGQ
jgi:hypothetical protein